MSAGVVRIGYVLDMAEIPTFQARQELAADPDGWLDERIGAIEDGLVLEVDGERLPLAVVDRRLSQPEGQGGLPTTRVSVGLRGGPARRRPGRGSPGPVRGRERSPIASAGGRSWWTPPATPPSSPLTYRLKA